MIDSEYIKSMLETTKVNFKFLPKLEQYNILKHQLAFISCTYSYIVYYLLHYIFDIKIDIWTHLFMFIVFLCGLISMFGFIKRNKVFEEKL